MASNSFGSLFRITTWGESHGPAIGVVIDGCPAGLPLSEEDIQPMLDRRAPGVSSLTTPRKEQDKVQILSGVFEGVTTGAPISLIIWNKDGKSGSYNPVRHLLKPGHANFTYLAKYGVFDHRGSGRASGRETACRVAAGAVALKILTLCSVRIIAYVKRIGEIELSHVVEQDPELLKAQVTASPVSCPDPETSGSMVSLIETVRNEKDSVGGVIECRAFGLPAGLGDPIYEKIEATLAKGVLSIPAAKAVEFGAGFSSCRMRGSEHNDPFVKDSSGKIVTETNMAGGTLGGITTGMPLVFSAGFKPTSSIEKAQRTVDTSGEEKEFTLPEGSRHDPCIVLRAVPVIEAMTALCLVDALLLNRTSTVSLLSSKSSVH